MSQTGWDWAISNETHRLDALELKGIELGAFKLKASYMHSMHPACALHVHVEAAVCSENTLCAADSNHCSGLNVTKCFCCAGVCSCRVWLVTSHWCKWFMPRMTEGSTAYSPD